MKEKILLDTNMMIYLLDDHILDEKISKLTKILYDSDKYVIAIHPNTIIEARKIKDENKKDIFISKLEVYKILESPPRATEDFNKQVGCKNENDLIDNEMLYAVVRNCVSYFITNDKRLLKKAELLKLNDRVLSIDDAIEKFKQEEFNQKVDYGNSQRVKSFIFSPLISLLILGIGIPTILKNGYGTNGVILIVLIAVLSFTFASCVFFNNNCVKYTFFAIASWGVVKFPGLIFSFDLGGITWLIGMKILFWLLGLILGIAAAILGFVICLPLSLFVYPFALHKSITKPEEYEVI